jgi:hypothetical protein
MNRTDTRQHVHSLVDRLPPAQLAVIEGLLSVMVDPVAHALRNAPVEDEQISDEEEQTVRRSKEWFKHNQGTSFEDVVAELGFSMDQVFNSKEPA